MKKLNQLIEKCKGGICIEINPHKDCCLTIDEYLRLDVSFGVYDNIDNDEIYNEIIKSNNIIIITLYLHTLVDCNVITHYDLETAIDIALKL